MVNEKGQNASEFAVLLGLLTALGLLLMHEFRGPTGKGGAIESMDKNAANAIIKDDN